MSVYIGDAEKLRVDREFIREVRAAEILDRIAMLAQWRECDLNHAWDWKIIGANTGIDTSADVKRNVRYARQWHHEILRMKRTRKMN